MAEGIIKFTVDMRQPGPSIALEDYQDIEAIRSRLWQIKLIGYDKQADVGYGNISRRRSRGGFVISGTQTGHKEILDGSNYVVVDAWDFAHNSVSCTGPCLPSSEALSHAALYQRSDVGGVIHVHSRVLWDALIQAGTLSTEEDIAYGSEALYHRLAELTGPGSDSATEGRRAVGTMAVGTTAARSGPAGKAPAGKVPAGSAPGLPLVIVTKGHQDGVFVAGNDLAEAYEEIVGLLV